MGYVVSDIICVIVLCRMKLMVVSRKFVVATLAMAGFIIAWRLLFSKAIIIGTITATIFTLIMVILYKTEITEIVKIIKHRKGNEKDE